MIRDFVEFIRNPDKAFADNLNVIAKLWRMILLFICLVVVQIIIQIVFLSISDPGQGAQINRYVENLSEKLGLWYVILLGPFIEELAYRLPLTEFNAKYLRVSISLILATLLYWLAKLVYPVISVDPLLLEIVIALILYIAFSRFDFSFLMYKWDSTFKLFFWFSILLFCLLHLPQLLVFGFDFYTISRALISFATCALFYGFIRVRLGFLYAVGIHSLYNLTATIFN